MAETIKGLEMHIKRSVSRDGRIDSLSLEVSYPVESDSTNEIKEGAEELIGVLSNIVNDFKQENGKNPEVIQAIGDCSFMAGDYERSAEAYRQTPHGKPVELANSSS